jgi:magnesium chelatase family protein
MIDRYARRVSGPLRDRIDIWVTMPRVDARDLVRNDDPEPSRVVAARIAAARALSLGRSQGLLNARLRGRALRSACRLSRAAAGRAVYLAELEGASGRGTERLLRVARTIADLAGAESVGLDHLGEAAGFRSTLAATPTALAS